MNTVMPDKINRSSTLDLIRVIAISLVFFIHIAQAWSLFNHTFILKVINIVFGIKDFCYISLAGLGVIIFIILSGMVLEYNYGSKQLSYFSFIGKRFKKIYITYWIIFFLSIPLIYKIVNLDFNSLFYNFSGLMIYNGAAWADYYLPAGWFIGVILYLYLFFPLLSKLLKQKPVITLLVLLLISVGSRIIIGHMDFWHRGPDSFPLCRLFEFGLGIWLIQQIKVRNYIALMDQKIKIKGLVFLSEFAFPLFLVHDIFLKLEIINKNAPILSTLKFIEYSFAFTLLVIVIEKIINSKNKKIILE